MMVNGLIDKGVFTGDQRKYVPKMEILFDRQRLYLHTQSYVQYHAKNWK